MICGKMYANDRMVICGKMYVNDRMLICGKMYANDRMVICGKMYVNDRNGWMSFETLHVIDATLNGSTDMRLSSGERARLKIYET